MSEKFLEENPKELAVEQSIIDGDEFLERLDTITTIMRDIRQRVANYQAIRMMRPIEGEESHLDNLHELFLGEKNGKISSQLD